MWGGMWGGNVESRAWSIPRTRAAKDISETLAYQRATLAPGISASTPVPTAKSYAQSAVMSAAEKKSPATNSFDASCASRSSKK